MSDVSQELQLLWVNTDLHTSYYGQLVCRYGQLVFRFGRTTWTMMTSSHSRGVWRLQKVMSTKEVRLSGGICCWVQTSPVKSGPMAALPVGA